MLRDIRHGFRVLLQAKGWTTVVVLSLAVGIGANIALFSTINGLLLKKLPVRDPESLVRLRWFGDNDMVNDSSDYGFTPEIGGKRPRTTFSYPMFEHFRAANKSLSDIFATVPLSTMLVMLAVSAAAGYLPARRAARVDPMIALRYE